MAYNATNEQHLLQEMQLGNRGSLAQLYDLYAAPLYGCIMQWTGQPSLANKILEEAFIRTWQHCHSIDCSKLRLFTYLYRICRQLADEQVNQSKKESLRQLY